MIITQHDIGHLEDREVDDMLKQLRQPYYTDSRLFRAFGDALEVALLRRLRAAHDLGKELD